MITAPPETDEQLSQLLRERGYRVTSPRLVIHRMLRERDQHVSADDVRAAVVERLPGTSAPTVYATLELFEALGLLRRVGTVRGASQFDSRTTPHAHAVCRVCGRVEDLEIVGEPTEALDVAVAGGFAAEHTEVLVSGRCAACAAAPATR